MKKLTDKKEIARLYVEENKSLVELGKIYDVFPSTVQRFLQRNGIIGRSYKEAYRAKYPKGRFKELSGNWNGGKRMFLGYVQIMMPEHPYAQKAGYIMEHRLVMEKKIGRYLRPDEIIHHINHIRTDNRPENLEIKSNGEHAKEYWQENEKLRNVLDLYRKKYGRILEDTF